MKHVNTTIDTRMTAGTNAASASGSATGAVMAPADLDKKLADVQAADESKIDGVQRRIPGHADMNGKVVPGADAGDQDGKGEAWPCGNDGRL